MSETVFIYEPKESLDEVRRHIQQCEGKHVQQVAYSSFMNCLTQICFGCQRIRSTVGWSNNPPVSWSLEEKKP